MGKKRAYKSVKQNDALPLEILCLEINLRLKVLKDAIKNHLNNVTVEDLLIDLNGKQRIFPLEVVPGNIGPLDLGLECIASLKGFVGGENPKIIGVALNKVNFDKLLKALRDISEKYHLTVDIQKRVQ